MPCYKIKNGVVCTFGGETIHKGKDRFSRTWRWTFHDYVGPIWVDKFGNEREPPRSPRHPFWQAYDKWWIKRLKEKTK